MTTQNPTESNNPSLPNGTAISLLPCSFTNLTQTGSALIAVVANLRHCKEFSNLSSERELRSQSHSSCYDLAIATKDPSILESLLETHFSSLGYVKGRHFDTYVQRSRMHNKERNIRYPYTTHLHLRFGIPFNLRELLDPTGIDYYMSSLYNNGAYPIINGWIDIPEKYKKPRMEIINRLRHGNNKDLVHTQLEALRKYDTGIFNRLVELGEPINFHYNFSFDPRHTDVDTLHPDFSVRLYGNQILNKVKPYFGKCTATVIDCLQLKDARHYLPATVNLRDKQFNSDSSYLYLQRCFGRIAKNSSPYAFTKSPLSELFIKLRCSTDKQIREPRRNSDIFESFLIQIIELKFESN